MTSFSDTFMAKTIRLHNTFLLHRSPPKDSNQENWSSAHFCWFKSSTWSRKSPSGEVWTPVQAPNMASNHGTIAEMSVFSPWHSMELHGYSMDTPWQVRRIPWISIDFHGIPWISIDFHGFPWISMEFHGAISHGIVRIESEKSGKCHSKLVHS